MAGEPRAVKEIVSEVLARKGFGRIRSIAALRSAWDAAVGPDFARQSEPGAIRKGVLEVVVSHSAVLQELTFQKADLVRKLAELLPDQPIRNLRFRVGDVE
jgi:predicted nucleic acid-binding Zn ribbon protein